MCLGGRGSQGLRAVRGGRWGTAREESWGVRVVGVREGNWALNVGRGPVCCSGHQGGMSVCPPFPSLVHPLSRPPTANLPTPPSQVVVGTTIQWPCRHQPGQGAEDVGCGGRASCITHTCSTAQGRANPPLQPSAPACLLPSLLRPPPPPPPNAHLHLRHRSVLTRPSRLPTTCALATTRSVAALRAVKQWRGWARTPPSRHA